MAEEQLKEAASADPARFRVDGDGKPLLVGGRCRHCGCTTWSVRKLCPRCWEADSMEEIALPAEGELYSMTEIHRAQAGFRAPYAVGVVDLPGPVRVFGRVHWPAGQRWLPGTRVELIAERIDLEGDAAPLWVPAFRPRETPHA